MATQILPTRGAVIFGDQNQNVLRDTISQIQQQRDLEVQQRQRQAQQMAQSWQKNMLSASNGKLWSDQIGAIEQDHLKKGEQLMVQGIDPYTSLDPKAAAYRQERLEVEGMRKYREALEKEYNSLNNIIKSDPSKWSSSDLNKLNEFVSGSKFEDLYKQNAQLPTVNQRFNPNTFFKGSAVPFSKEVVEDGVKVIEKGVDRDATEKTILSRLVTDTSGMSKDFLNQLTSGYDVSQLKNIPDDFSSVRNLVDGFYDYNAQFREELAKQGITSKEDPRYQQALDIEAQDMINAKANYDSQMDNLISSISGGQTVSRVERPDYTEEDRRWNRESRNMQRTRFNERNNSSGSGGRKGSGSDESYITGDNVYVSYKGGEGRAPLYDHVAFNTGSEVEFIGNGTIDLSTGVESPDKTTLSGVVVGLGNVPTTKATNGKVVIAQENYSQRNPDKVKYEKMALVRTKVGSGSSSRTKEILVPAKNLPKTMSKDKIYQQFMNTPYSGGNSNNEQSNKPSTSTRRVGMFD